MSKESKNPIIQLGNDQLVKEVAQAIENEAKANAQKQNTINNQNQTTSPANNQSTVNSNNTLDSDFDHRKYIEPNTQMTYKQRYKSLVSNIDYLFIYDTVSNREFLVRIFRMSSPPLAWCDYSYEIKKEN